MRNQTIKSNVPKTTIFAKRGYADGERDVSSLHYHDEIELLPIFDGVFCCTVGGTQYVAEAGDIIFINSGVPHATRSITESHTGLLQFRQSDFTTSEAASIIKYTARLQDLGDSAIRILRMPELMATVLEIIVESEGKRPGYEMYIKSGIFRVLGCLFREGILSDREQMYKTKEVQKILPALSYINENYQDDLTLERVSEILSFDPSYFCRIFKAATGATFTEYMNFVRVCKAERMLAKTEESILAISEAVGFSSVSYFNRIFKKYRGCSPRQYRLARYIAINRGEVES